MSIAHNATMIRTFTCFKSLDNEQVKQVIKQSVIQQLPAGRLLFKQGENDQWAIYLLSGTIELSFSDASKKQLKADTDAARVAIENTIPRMATARAVTDISLLITHRDLEKSLVNNHSDVNNEVQENADNINHSNVKDDDWREATIMNAYGQKKNISASDDDEAMIKEAYELSKNMTA